MRIVGQANGPRPGRLPTVSLELVVRGAFRGDGIVRSYCRGLAVLLFKMGGVVDLLVMRI